MTTRTKRQQSYRLGHLAEQFACIYLYCKGYRVLARRMRNSCGEIDVVAMKKNCIIAVEVKARKNVGDCMHSITTQKQQRTARALALWVASHKIAGLSKGSPPNMRFDVICITPFKWPTHIKDAWR